jgi:hypothetical protein
MDVVSAFLNPEIDRDNVYMALPEGINWIDPRINDQCKAVRLLKALYGLKQAPRLWYQHINSFLISLGFVQPTADPNLDIKTGMLILLCVDNLLITYRNQANHNAKEIKQQLNQQYHMIDLGTASSS